MFIIKLRQSKHSNVCVVCRVNNCQLDITTSPCPLIDAIKYFLPQSFDLIYVVNGIMQNNATIYDPKFITLPGLHNNLQQ